MGSLDSWLERMPQPGETCVISDSPEYWRRDALMFDRVFAPFTGNSEPPDIPIEYSFGSASTERDFQQTNWHGGLAALHITEEELRDMMLMAYNNRYLQHRTMATWSASERGMFLRHFSDSQRTAYEGALNNIPIVLPDVDWQEVKDFREDGESKRKYRDLRLWLTDGLKAQSVDHATDLVGQKVEDYRWAIRKHGLRTMTGALSHLFEWKNSLATIGGVGLAGAFGSVPIAALVGGLAISSSIGAWVFERRLSASEVERGDGREVAILMDIQDRFGLPAL